MPRVLIVNMPLFSLRWPNLGTSLLKAQVLRRGIPCQIAYFNYDLAEMLGEDRYTWLADSFAFVLGGERLFARHYFGDRLPDDEAFFSDVLLAADPGLTSVDRRDYEAAGAVVEPFLDRCAARDWSQYAVVGFAASFQQTMASMCLARRIKSVAPGVRIVFGGAACEGPMGIELIGQFPEIDYVCVGEADAAFPRLVERILGRSGDLPAGVVARESVSGGARPDAPDPCTFLTRDLDALAYPDFDDYFERLAGSPLREEVDPLLFFETSRGCWWGQKHHCAFCGLNGSTLSYRSKTPRRAVDELRHLVERHGVHRACSSDNILDHRYFDTFLPLLRGEDLDLAFVFEMKTNLARRQVELLLEAGMGAAQLGIETFITPVLKLIGKGATAMQNVQTLKWLSEPGIEVKWNVLYGFPNENPNDYAGLADLVPSLVHLAPPMAAGRVRMDRFSPYFEAPERWGLINKRPARAFRYVYPFPEESLARLAYYFEFDYADGRNPLDYAAPALAEIERWQGLAGSVTLRSFDRGDGVTIVTDTRPCATEFQRRLSGWRRGLYEYCDTGRSLKTILRSAAEWNGDQIEAEDVRHQLDSWVSDRIMVQLDGRYLNLALRMTE